MISKELLAKALWGNESDETDITTIRDAGDFIMYIPSLGSVHEVGINIYELAHKCKEWAKSNEYSINSGNRLDGTPRYDAVCVHKNTDVEDWDDFFSGMFDTEPDAIFKACEWILSESNYD